MRPILRACLLVLIVSNSPLLKSDASNFHHLFNGGVKTAEVFSTCCGEVGRTAAATLRDVRHAMRIDYFEDNNLLRKD